MADMGPPNGFCLEWEQTRMSNNEGKDLTGKRRTEKPGGQGRMRMNDTYENTTRMTATGRRGCVRMVTIPTSSGKQFSLVIPTSTGKGYCLPVQKTPPPPPPKVTYLVNGPRKKGHGVDGNEPGGVRDPVPGSVFCEKEHDQVDASWFEMGIVQRL